MKSENTLLKKTVNKNYIKTEISWVGSALGYFHIEHSEILIFKINTMFGHILNIRKNPM